MNPDTFVAGGLISDVDVEIIEALYTRETPDGYTARDRKGGDPIFLRLTLKNLEDGVETPQYWSAGGDEAWVPSEDGSYLVSTGKENFGLKTKAAHLFQSMVANGGMPKGKLDENGGVALLVGSKVHVVQVPYDSGVSQERQEGQRAPQVLSVTRVIKWAWDKRGGGGSGATKSEPATKSGNSSSGSGSGSGSVEDAAAENIMEVLADNDGGPMKLSVLKAKLFALLSKKQIKADVRNPITKLLVDTDFVSGRQEFSVDGDMVSLG
jgi:hypothetical protein